MIKFKVLVDLGFIMPVLFFLSSCKIIAQQNGNWQELNLLDKQSGSSYVEFTSDDLIIKKGNAYPSSNLFDGYFKTCWVLSSSKTDKNTSLYIRLPDSIDIDKIILNIFSGYGKSRKLYYANARPKKIKLSLFIAFNPEGFVSETKVHYIMKKYPFNKTIELSDTFDVQSFPLNIKKNELLEFKQKALLQIKNSSVPNYTVYRESLAKSLSSAYILKVEIKDSYPGLKYKDVCISEIFFNDRFITPFPDRYNEILNVYIKDENTLLADFGKRKGLIIYKDTSSVFTYVDWPENKNWAILHYVSRNAVGEDSRIEELYTLIDLKNREAVDSKFKKYTGNTTMFICFDKNENGDIFINEGKYRVELR